MKPLFEQAYQSLNLQQKQAVDTIEGPVMVIAGPGTGKTQILTLRIARILKDTDASPREILALTFTDAGVVAMKKRLHELIGTRAHQVVITTFHSFCNDIIQAYPHVFTDMASYEPVLDIDKTLFLEQIMTQNEVESTHLRPSGDILHNVSRIEKAIETIKKEGYTPQAFYDLVEQEEQAFNQREDLYHTKGAHKGAMKKEHRDFLLTIQRNKELARIYQAYQQLLKDNKKYDFTDMILSVVDAMRHNQDFLFDLQEAYQYVLVDEHQDTNNAQNELVRLLITFHDNPNIFVVGDDKQAIYRFQGASVENFYALKTTYPNIKTIELTYNYRSTQDLLDTAHALMPNSSALIQGNTSLPKQGTGCVVTQYADQFQEAHGVIESIKKLQAQGVALSNIAIIARKHNYLEPYVSFLVHNNIPFQYKGGIVLMEHSLVQALYSIMLVLNNTKQAYNELSKVLFILFPQNAKDILTFLASYQNHTTQDILVYGCEYQESRDIQNFFHGMVAMVTYCASHDKAWDIVAKTLELFEFFFISAQQKTLLTDIQALHTMTMYTARNGNISLSQWLEKCDILRRTRFRITPPSTDQQGVACLTAHGAKGLEFDYVFMVGAQKNQWEQSHDRSLELVPSLYTITHTQQDATQQDDSRRLVYVAMTRAKQSLDISYIERDILTDREMFPMSFLDEIQNHTTKYQQKSNPLELPLYRIHTTESHPNETRQAFALHIRKYLEQKGFSATSLNDYAQCPWLFIERHVLGIRDNVYNPSFVFGTIIHKTLEQLYSQALYEHKLPEALINQYRANIEQSLQEGFVMQGDYATMEQKGVEALRIWATHRDIRPAHVQKTMTEQYITCLINGIRLHGKVDKIELLGHDSGRDIVAVTDYKTGRTHTLESLQREKDKGVYQQLALYKLMLEQGKGTYRVKESYVDFIGPHTSGVCIRHNIPLHDNDSQELLKRIEQYHHELVSLLFTHKPCSCKTVSPFHTSMHASWGDE